MRFAAAGALVGLAEQMRFERSVPAADNVFEIVLFSYSGVPVPARNNNFKERDQYTPSPKAEVDT